MLGCRDCQRVFDTADEEIEYVDGNEGYKFSVCPYCHSDMVKEVYRCTLCGDYHTGEDDECESCKTEFNSYLNAFYFETSAFWGCEEERIKEALERRMG